MKNQKAKTVKIFEAFAGIGSQFQALKNISNDMNWNVESVGIIEWFIPAIIGYQAIHYPFEKSKIKKEKLEYDVILSNDSKRPISAHGKKKQLMIFSSESALINRSAKKCNNFFDINNTKGKDLPNDIDIFTYSFPCQDISNQGKQKGFEKNSKTRSGLLWQIERILKEIDKKHLPKYLLLENVKSILNYKHIGNLKLWLNELEKLGYENKIYTLNASNFGSCQNRERVFVLSILKKYKKQVNFEFQDLENVVRNKKEPIKKILEKNISYDRRWDKYSLVKQKYNEKNNIQKYKIQNYTNFQSEASLYDVNFSGPTLTASGAMSRIKLLFDVNKKKHIRFMTPLEAFRYMGFHDSCFKTLSENVSDQKIIYLCGNSISIQLLEAIFRTLRFDNE